MAYWGALTHVRCPVASLDGLRHAKATFYPCPDLGSQYSAFAAWQCEARYDVTILKDGSHARQPGVRIGHVDRTHSHVASLLNKTLCCSVAPLSSRHRVGLHPAPHGADAMARRKGSGPFRKIFPDPHA
jgi:hypothetical protein